MPELLTNLKIIGTEKADGFSVPLIFEAMFNPASYAVSHKSNYDTKEAAGKDGADPTFKNIEPETFTLDFLIDGTGVSNPAIQIPAQVALFNKVTVQIKGATHRPNYLVVQWGTFIRECVLESATITYTLFSKAGIPLRAKIAATFIERKASELNAIASMFSSPDLTHFIEVKDKDILPLLVFRNLGDSKYYLQTARVNRLKNFRHLIAGKKIIIPPLA